MIEMNRAKPTARIGEDWCDQTTSRGDEAAMAAATAAATAAHKGLRFAGNERPRKRSGRPRKGRGKAGERLLKKLRKGSGRSKKGSGGVRCEGWVCATVHSLSIQQNPSLANRPWRAGHPPAKRCRSVSSPLRLQPLPAITGSERSMEGSDKAMKRRRKAVTRR